MHAVIRCDATESGGIGHLVRAVSVAGAAQAAGHTVELAGSIRSALAASLVESAGLDIVEASEDLGTLAAERGASVIHIDDYTVSADALAQVQRSGALLSSMEDGRFGRRPADIVVDSTIRAEMTGRPDDGSGEELLGIEYAPMRRDVRVARELRSRRPLGPTTVVDVLIVMGGTDAAGAAGTLASLCDRADGVGRITVIAPKHSWDAVRSEAGERAQLEAPSPEFLDHVVAADLVISAAGTTSWELACIGVPSLLVAVVENQEAGLEAAVQEGIARGLGPLREVRANPSAAVATIRDAVAELRDGRSWAEAGRDKVDGLGADRIVAAWERALEARIPGTDQPAGLHVRRALSEDAEQLLRWRNDPVTRKVSRSQAPVPWRDHEAWFARTQTNPDRELYVVQCGDTPVGTVRFDALEGDEWEVSITLAPEARGRRLALAVLHAAETVFDEGHRDSTVIAAILPGNGASQRLFARAGYEVDPSRRDGDFDILIRRDPS